MIIKYKLEARTAKKVDSLLFEFNFNYNLL